MYDSYSIRDAVLESIETAIDSLYERILKKDLTSDSCETQARASLAVLYWARNEPVGKRSQTLTSAADMLHIPLEAMRNRLRRIDRDGGPDALDDPERQKLRAAIGVLSGFARSEPPRISRTCLEPGA